MKLGTHLDSHNGMAFSTYDRDNDLSNASCADVRAGWWYHDCYHVNPQGKLPTFHNKRNTLFSEMKVRLSKYD